MLLILSGEPMQGTLTRRVLFSIDEGFELHVFSEFLVNQARIEGWLDTFGHDRSRIPKGLVEVVS